MKFKANNSRFTIDIPDAALERELARFGYKLADFSTGKGSLNLDLSRATDFEITDLELNTA